MAFMPGYVSEPPLGTGKEWARARFVCLVASLSSMRAAPGLFYRLAEARPVTSAYPLEELNAYLRQHPERAAAAARTLSYLDPVAAARRATCPVTVGDAALLAPLRTALGKRYRPAE